MIKKMLGIVLLGAAKLAFAAVIPVTFYNYTSAPGQIFIGTSSQIINGPFIDNDGNPVTWSPVVNGQQAVGLSGQICFLSTGPLVLNAALYTGDTISIVYGQPQFPNGISCGCLGSACALA